MQAGNGQANPRAPCVIKEAADSSRIRTESR